MYRVGIGISTRLYGVRIEGASDRTSLPDKKVNLCRDNVPVRPVVCVYDVRYCYDTRYSRARSRVDFYRLVFPHGAVGE